MVTRKTTLELIATRFGIPLSTLDMFDKEMVKHGVRPHSTRGRNPPPLTPLDVTHIALAATWTRSVRGVAAAVAELSALPLRGGIRELRDMDLSTYDFAYSQDGAKLTPAGIIKGALLQSYPRDILPMTETFGGSLANIIERAPFDDEVKELKVEVVWPPLSAIVRFRIDKFQYHVDFGDEIPREAEEPIYSFTYGPRLLEYLGEIYRS